MEGMELLQGGLGITCLSLGPLLNVNTIIEQVCCQPKIAKILENSDVKPPSLHNSQCWMNHIIVGVRRDLWGSSSPTPLLKQVHLLQAAQDCV